MNPQIYIGLSDTQKSAFIDQIPLEALSRFKGTPLLNNFNKMVDVVCAYYKINRGKFLSRGRKEPLPTARKIAYTILREIHMDEKCVETRLGELFNKDRTTIYVQALDVLGKLPFDKQLKQDFVTIQDRFFN